MCTNIRQIMFTLLACFCLLTYSYSQKTTSDSKQSLQTFIDKGNAKDRLDFFFSLENRYQQSEYRWTTQINDFLKESKNSKDSLGILQYNIILAQVYFDVGDYKKSIKVAEEIHGSKIKLDPKTRLHLLEVMDKAYATLKIYDKQLDIRNEIVDSGIDISMYDIYANLGLYNQAVRDYIMEFESTLEDSDFLGNALYHNQMAEYHRLDDAYFMAISKADRALNFINLYLTENRYDKTAEEIAEARLIKGKIQGNLGKCRLKLKEYNTAIPLLESAVTFIREETRGKFSVELLELWANLADCYLQLNIPLTAKQYLDSISFYEKNVNITGFNRLLAEYYLKVKESDSASLFFKKYIETKDSITASKSKRELLGTLVSLDLKNQKATIQKQKKDIENTKVEILQRDKKINYSIVALMVALLVCLVAILAYFKSVKNKKVIEEQKNFIELSLAEKDSLLKEIHHRVKNNLQMVSSLLSMQTKNTKSKEAIAALEEGRSRVKAMALIHQKLYQNEDLSVIQMQEYIESLVNSVQSVYKKGGHKINIIIDAEGTELDIDRAIPIGLIINELVSNSLKYAFTGREDGQIYISVRMNGKLGVFEYLDNGNGLPEDVEKRAGSSLGIKLIERLVNQLRSTLNFDKDVDGVRFWFNFS
ncbi:histidine kinase dimerization/phosphoacceptor domain -containing protein [Ascidiimonas sp. W6]|uniref:tetratricopeptide repeat-containing sensor histidine kinase n=1 Tax=Ascidiimonas meishanensis TaxID=3128903 RepID=UPI0030ED4736